MGNRIVITLVAVIAAITLVSVAAGIDRSSSGGGLLAAGVVAVAVSVVVQVWIIRFAVRPLLDELQRIRFAVEADDEAEVFEPAG